MKLGPLILKEDKLEVIKTFFTYKDLNAKLVRDIPATDLTEHRVFLKEGVKPWNRSRRHMWSTRQRFWLNKLINDGIESGMFEPIVGEHILLVGT